VLDLGVQAQGVEVVRPLLENRRDFRLGLRQLAEFDEHASIHQALLILGDRFDHPLYLAPGAGQVNGYGREAMIFLYSSSV
jgi:hypothetical protein